MELGSELELDLLLASICVFCHCHHTIAGGDVEQGEPLGSNRS